MQEPGGLSIREVIDAGPVLPVVVIEDPSGAVALANALLEGGITVIEITLRTAGALEAVARIAQECPDMIVGTGSVRTPQQVQQAADAGARFLVTPGSPQRLLEACAASRLPTLPGAATVTEMLTLAERGFSVVKFFPAEQLGGADALRAISGPVPDLDVCPTGGITQDLAADYLKLPTVPCVGASWVTPACALREGDWAQVRRLARRAQELRREIQDAEVQDAEVLPG